MGTFCPQCGQRQSGRLELGQLASEFAARFLSTERGFWRTLVTMTLRPGRVARDYLAGRRSCYVSPLMWYVVCAAAQLLGLWVLQDEVGAIVVHSLPDSYFDMLRENGVAAPREWAAGRYLSLVQNAYSWLGLFTFVVPMALTLRLVAGRAYNLAESLVVSLHSVGHVMLITAVTGQVLTRVSVVWHGFVSYGLYFVYAVWTVGGCFGWRPRFVIAGLLGVVVGGVSFFVTLSLLARWMLTSGY